MSGATTTRHGMPIGEHYPNCRRVQHWWAWRCDCAELEARVAADQVRHGVLWSNYIAVLRNAEWRDE